MLPDIRAVIAAAAAAISLLIMASGLVAALRVAQESRAGSLHAELARRGQAAAIEAQRTAVIETPGPTLLVRAPEVESVAAAAADEPPTPPEPSAVEREQAAQQIAAVTDSRLVASVPAEPEPDNKPAPPASVAAPESSPTATAEAAAEPAAIVAGPRQTIEPQPEPPSLAPVLALGGPSPEEIAEAKARRKAAEQARARKAAVEKKKKARAARIARERKLAAQRAAEAARQQASAPSQPGGFAYTPSGSFNNAPFGNGFGVGGATNQR